MVYPEIWKNFNNTPFYISCPECGNIVNQHHDSFCERKEDCDFCQNKRTYLYVPYNEKDLGAKWDNIQKKWFILNGNPNMKEILRKWKRCNID